MSFIDKLKNKLESKRLQEESTPAYAITQPITLPIYELNLKGLVDADSIKEKCLINRTGTNHKPTIVRNGWQSPYYYTGSVEFEIFSELIGVIENKLNLIAGIRNPNTKYKLMIFWIVIYGKGTHHEWHSHAHKLENFTGYSGVYYPAASDKAEPIEFKNNDTITSIPVRKDKLLIFPSVLMHRVPACIDSELRIAVSFNCY
jgi:hypothetical protein